MGQDIPIAPIPRKFLPHPPFVPAALRVSTAFSSWSAGCSPGVFLIPETFPCVQDHAVPTGIAYQRLQSSPRANPTIAASSVLLIQRDALKNWAKNVRFTLGVSWVKFLSCQETSSVLLRTAHSSHSCFYLPCTEPVA